MRRPPVEKGTVVPGALLVVAALLTACGTTLAANRTTPPASSTEAPAKQGTGRRVITVVQTKDGKIVVRWEPQPVPETQLVLTDWYRAHARRVEPIMTAWKNLGRELQTDRLPGLTASCADLRRAVATLEGRELPPAPHPVVRLHVSRSLSLVRRAADVCRRDHAIELAYRYRVTQESLLETHELLRLFGVGR